MTERDTHEMRLARWARLATFPTTNGRIAISLILAAATAAVYLFSAVVVIWRGDIDPTTAGVQLAGCWTPAVEWLGFLCVWAGLDVLQFSGKRFSDAGYAASKQRPSGAQEAPHAP